MFHAQACSCAQCSCSNMLLCKSSTCSFSNMVNIPRTNMFLCKIFMFLGKLFILFKMFTLNDVHCGKCSKCSLHKMFALPKCFPFVGSGSAEGRQCKTCWRRAGRRGRGWARWYGSCPAYPSSSPSGGSRRAWPSTDPPSHPSQSSPPYSTLPWAISQVGN